MEKIKTIISENPSLEEILYCRGYLITDKDININEGSFPFYNNWDKHNIELSSFGVRLNIFTHKWLNVYSKSDSDISVSLIGHAYNPFDILFKEEDIVETLISAVKKNLDCFFDKVSELTGGFTILLSYKKQLILLQDCCGIMPAYYGKVNGSVFITSHAQLVADLCNLNTAKNITEYMNAPFFKIGITQLCGIDSPFSALKMLSANTFLEVNKMIVSRFYPKRELKEADSDTLKHISNILKNSLLLCSKKWNCSISLTGGVDSKMTLAAANGLYDKFHYFSFISSDAERKDAEAAHDICENIGVDHDIYLIPENEMEIPKFDNYSAIIQHNQSYLRNKSGNDVRKRIWLAQNTDIDIEIKSHASEVGRAFYYKKLERKKFKYPLTVRDMSNLAKRNLFDRKILVDMDLSFQRFKDVSDFGNFPKGYDETDMFYWENRMPAWGSLVKQSFDLSHETTILYNNRRLLELFMSFPLEERINDTNQHLLIQKMNNKIHDLNISVNNSMKNKSRILLEKIFFSINK